MYRRNIFRICGIATMALFVLSTSVSSQTAEKSAKELIAGNWTLMIADNVRGNGNKVPGFGPLPKGSARFGADGRYSLEVMPNADRQPAVKSSGTYALDDSGKTLTLKVRHRPAW